MIKISISCCCLIVCWSAMMSQPKSNLMLLATYVLQKLDESSAAWAAY